MSRRGGGFGILYRGQHICKTVQCHLIISCYFYTLSTLQSTSLSQTQIPTHNSYSVHQFYSIPFREPSIDFNSIQLFSSFHIPIQIKPRITRKIIKPKHFRTNYQKLLADDDNRIRITYTAISLLPFFLSWQPLNFCTDKTLMMTRQSGIRSSPSSLSTLLRIFLPPTLSSFFLFQLNLINRDSFKALFRLHCTKTQVQFGSLHSALARYFTLYIATPPYSAADTLTD